MKILIIDDDAFLRDMYATKFTEEGDEVLTAASGRQALELIETESKQPFDVVLLDIVMPEMTGLDFLKAMKGLPNTKDTKAIVLSNQGEANDIDAAKAFGVHGYIIKAEHIPSSVVKQVHDLTK